MENIAQKAAFLRSEYANLLRQIDPATERRWGKMNFQQMVEHMSDSVRIGNGRDPHQLQVPEESVAKMQAFVMSDKPFRENTPNRLLPEEPVAVRNATLEGSIDELQQEIDYLFEVFEGQPGKTIMNPFFGALDFNLWITLLYKHAWHHLRQFGVDARTPDVSTTT